MEEQKYHHLNQHKKSINVYYLLFLLIQSQNMQYVYCK